MVAAPVLPIRPGLLRAPALPSHEAPEGLPRGRLIELAGGPDAARTTAAVQVLLASQREGDPVAWIQPEGGELFPPDLAAAGLDLDALLVVHVPRRSEAGIAKAAELVLRTGAFGALALDVSDARLPRGEAWLGRLSSLAREHDCRCVFVAAPSDRSLGPLVGLRLLARRRRVRPASFVIDTDVLKDKSGWRPTLPAPRAFRGPEGMP